MMTGTTTLRVYPDAESVEHAVLEATEGSQPCLDARYFLTWSQFVELFLPSSWQRRGADGRLMLQLLVAHGAPSIQPNPWGNFIEQPAFARAAVKFFNELKGGGCSPEEFLGIASKLSETRREKAVFLARLFQSVAERASALQLFDTEDALMFAQQALQKGKFPSILTHCQQVEFEGLYDISFSRLQFLNSLSQALAPRGIEVRWNAPGSGKSDLDAVIDSVFLALENDASPSGLQADKSFAFMDHPHHGLASCLFAPFEADVPEACPWELVSLANPRQEAREIARRIHGWLRDGTPPEQIAVAFRELNEDAERVAQELNELGIPSRIRLGKPLISTMTGRLAAGILQVLEEDFPSLQVAQLLSNRFLPHVRCESVSSVAYIFQLAGVRDDRRGATEARLRQLSNKLRDSQKHLGPEIFEVHSKFQKLKAILSDIPESGLFSTMLHSWWTAVRNLGLQEGVLALTQAVRGSDRVSEKAFRASVLEQNAFESLSELVENMKLSLSTLSCDLGPLTRNDFCRWLLDLMSERNLASVAPRNGAVRILEVRELVGKKFKKVWVGGLVDGRFPGNDLGTILFPDGDKHEVNQIAREKLDWKRDVFRLLVGDLEQRLPFRLAEDRFLLFHAIVSAQESIVLSFARAGHDGREQLPSSFVAELKKRSGRPVRAHPMQVLPVWDDVASVSQLQERVVLETLAKPQLRHHPRDGASASMRKVFGAEPWFLSATDMKRIDEERMLFFAQETLPAGPYSGGIIDPEAQSYIAERLDFGQQHPVSASTLNRFGNCRFQGFVSHILKVKDPKFPDEELSNSSRGVFLHKVMEILVPTLKERGFWGRAFHELPPHLLDEVMERASKEFQDIEMTGHPVLWAMSQERVKQVVQELLSVAHQVMPFDELEPTHTELKFGSEKAERPWQNVQVPEAFPGETPVYFSGTIDRVDTAGARAGIIDYKTRLPSVAKLAEKLLRSEFQIPIYLIAAKTAGLIRDPRAVWLSFSEGKQISFDDVLKQMETSLEEFLATDAPRRAEIEKSNGLNFANAVHGLLKSVREGQLGPRAIDCDLCSYHSICRVGAQVGVLDDA